MPDHVHLLLGLKPDVKLSDIVREIKAISSKYIYDRRLTRSRFEWQKGFGGFTVGRKDLDMVANYIREQESHHRTVRYEHEYVSLLKEHAIEYDDEFLFLS